jgi:hypothetical protein
MIAFALCALLALPAGTQKIAPDKSLLSPAQKKIESQLLQEIQRRADPAFVPGTPPEARLRLDDKGRVLVDIRADVTPALRKKVVDLEGEIESTSARDRSIVAWLPFAALEPLAGGDEILAIRRAPEAATHREP